MDLDDLSSHLDVFTGHVGALDSLTEFFFSSAFKGSFVSLIDSSDGSDFFRTLRQNGSSFNSSQELSSNDLMGIWEGFSLYELPSSWRWMRLDQVGSIVGGGTPDTSNSTYWANDAGTPWVTPADMRGQTMYVLRGKRMLTDIGLRESSSKLLPSNSVVFSSRAPIGNVGITGAPLATNQGFKSCVPFMPEMAKYIYFYLRFIRSQINERATGTTFKEVSGKQFAATPIPVPPLNIQESIVEGLEEFLVATEKAKDEIRQRAKLGDSASKSAVDAISTAQTPEEFQTAWERVQENWEVIAGTAQGIETLRGLILDLAVTGRLAPSESQSVNSATRDESLRDIEWSKFAPESWNLMTLGDACLKISDGTHKTPSYKDSGVPFLSIKDISGGAIDFSKTRFISQSEHDELCKRIKPSRGDVLFCRIGTLGKAITIETDREFSIFVSLGLLRPKPVLSPKFLEIALNSPISHKQFDSIKAGGSHAQKLNLGAMRQFVLWFPDLETQAKIVRQVAHLMELCNQLEASMNGAEDIAHRFARSVVLSSS